MKEHILAFGCEPITPLLTQTFAPRKMAVKAVPIADYAQTCVFTTGIRILF